MAETLNVKKRDQVGSLAANRLRREGRMPAVLYGHNEPAVSLSVPYDEIKSTVRHGAKVVDLAGDESGQALVQDLQWDTYARVVLHADLLRIRAGERVTVEIEVVGKGQAPGEEEGGVLTWINHSVEIEVTPANIPDRLHIDLSTLNIGDTVMAEQILDLPEGAELVTAPERVLLNCVPPMAEEEEPAEPGEGEPEVIGEAEGEETTEDTAEGES